MKSLLVFDENNPKCNLLKELFNIIDSKKNRKEMSKNGISNRKYYLDVFKILFISIFFQIERNYVVNKLNKNDKLRKDYCIQNNLSIDEVNKAFQAGMKKI